MTTNNLDEVCGLIGVEAATTLARRIKPVGRIRFLYIPAKPKHSSFITECIGYDAMGKLCDRFGGTQITLGCPERRLALEKARELLKTGANLPRIAREVGISRATIYRMAARRPEQASAIA